MRGKRIIGAIGCLLYVVVRLSSTACAAPVIWDYGPASGTESGSWQNITAGQNFAEKVRFNTPTLLTGYQHFGFSAPPGGVYHLKLLADMAGAPGALLASMDISPAAPSTAVPATSYFQTNFNLPNIPLVANTNYWIGLSGNGFEAAQESVRTPGDGMMAQFNGPAYDSIVGIGDQMFRLEGMVPTPATAPLAMILLAGWLRRRGGRTDRRAADRVPVMQN
jgi:hypothetical protein